MFVAINGKRHSNHTPCVTGQKSVAGTSSTDGFFATRLDVLTSLSVSVQVIDNRNTHRHEVHRPLSKKCSEHKLCQDTGYIEMS